MFPRFFQNLKSGAFRPWYRSLLFPALAGLSGAVLAGIVLHWTTGMTSIRTEISSARGVLAKIYCDSGSGFREENVEMEAIPYGRRQWGTFKVPTGQAQRIRFDPTDNAQAMIVHQVQWNPPWPARSAVLRLSQGEWRGVRFAEFIKDEGGWRVKSLSAQTPDPRITWERLPGWSPFRWQLYRISVVVSSALLAASAAALAQRWYCRVTDLSSRKS